MEMEMERHIRSLANKMGSSPGKPPASTHHSSASGQGIATLIVMIAVLTIIVMFCCFAAPGIRDLCKKYVFRTCVIDDPDRDNGSSAAESTNTPTLILLPHGRMLVVNQSMLSQLRADQSAGIDFMELSANVIRAQRRSGGAGQITGSTPSILDSDTTSKGLSRQSLNYFPPTYEDIFGGDLGKNSSHSDLPPSYSELSLMFSSQNGPIFSHRRSLTCDAITGQSPVQDIEMREITKSYPSSRNVATASGDTNSDIDQSPTHEMKLCEISVSHPGSPSEASVSRIPLTSNTGQSPIQVNGLCSINSPPNSSNGSLKKSMTCDPVQSDVQTVELCDATNSCQDTPSCIDAEVGTNNVNSSSNQEIAQGSERTDQNSVQISIDPEEVEDVSGPKSPRSASTSSYLCTISQETTNASDSYEGTVEVLATAPDCDTHYAVMRESVI